MKRVALLLAGVVMLLLAVGCNEKENTLRAKDVQADIVLVRSDLSIQASIIESFDKEYYDKEELHSFIEDEILEYNNEAGKDMVKMDSLHIKDNKACLVLNYKTMDQYAKFNSSQAKICSVEGALQSGLLSEEEVFKDYKTEINSSYEEWSREDCYLLVFEEPVELQINGTILYYNNAEKKDSRLTLLPGKRAYVIFKINK